MRALGKGSAFAEASEGWLAEGKSQSSDLLLVSWLRGREFAT